MFAFKIIKYSIINYPKRIGRLFRHFLSKGESVEVHCKISRIRFGFIELFFLLLEILFLPEIYQILTSIFKFNTRKLNAHELREAKSIFPLDFPYHLIRIDDKAYLGPRQKRFAYVSFFVINSWGQIDDAIFIHEMVHVWQYHKMGAVYIPRAICAQNSKMGYDYGGITGLNDFMSNQKKLKHFNLEQQADIIADFYERSKNTYGDAQELLTYSYFHADLT